MRAHRQLAGVSLATIAVVMVLPHRVAAAGFAGAPTVQSGSVSIDRSRANIDTITVGSGQAIVNWTPTDAGVGGGAINFLPKGNIANYVAGSALEGGGYTILNRILAADSARSILFDGAVNSAAGGAVWFYAPGGILLGANARFNVGSLLLTTGDPFVDPESGSFISGDQRGGSNYRVVNAIGSTAEIGLTPGAQINALAQGSYVVAVAPRISQAGAINVNGTAALVAAEAVDFKYNAGLFDITVSEGTGSAFPFIHSGSTTGPAAEGDRHRIYFVAIPKNIAMTMFIATGAGQQLGFDVAGAADVVGNAVVLSAGYDVVEASAYNPESNDTPSFGFTPVKPGIAASLNLGQGAYTSTVKGLALTAAAVGSPTGDMSFASNLDLRGGALAQIFAQSGRTISIGGDVRLVTATDFQVASGASHAGGTSNIYADAGTTLTIGGNATLNADGYGDPNPALGGTGTGGNASIVSGGGTITIAGDAALSARGYGAPAGEGSSGGNATGGNIFVVATGSGSLTIAGLASLDSEARGGRGDAFGGNATGGNNSLYSDNGTLTVGSASSFARGYGGNNVSGTAAAGRGHGGIAALGAGANGTTIVLGDVMQDARGYGGFSYAGTGGTGTGGTAQLNTFSTGTHTLALSGSVALDANGYGGEANAGVGTGGLGTGGAATLFLSGGGFQAGGPEGTLRLAATGFGGIGGNSGAGVGGQSRITGNGGVLTTSLETIIEANGIGGSGTGGAAIIDINAGTGTSFNFNGAVRLAATGRATSGNPAVFGDGGVGIGGTSRISINSGTLQIDQSLSIAADAYGSDGLTGGAATGGSTIVEARRSTISLGSVSASAVAVGGIGRAGAGGDATSSVIAVDAYSFADAASSIVIQSIDGNADATGGMGGKASDGATGGRGGDGTAGRVSLNGQSLNGSLSVGSLQISAVGRGGAGGNGGFQKHKGGAGGAGGTGTGGFSQSGIVSTIGGILTATGTFGSVSVTTDGIGGRGGNGDNGQVSGGGGGRGGDAAGGSSLFIARGAPVTADAVVLNARATGGDGGNGARNDDFELAARGNGGNAQGGLAAAAATPHFVTGDTGTLAIDSLTARASASGGEGLAGGNGIGGTARLGVEAPAGFTFVTLAGIGTVTNQVTLYAEGNGGRGAGDSSSAGGNGTGGMAEIVVGHGMLDVGYGVMVSANGSGGFSAGDGYGDAGPHGIGTGGLAQFLANDGTVHIDDGVVFAANGVSAGKASGGRASFVTTLGTTVLNGSLGLRADADGFDASGGQATLQSDQGGSTTVSGSTTLTTEADGEFTAGSGSIKLLVGSGAGLDLGSLSASGASSADNASGGSTFLGIDGGSLRVRGPALFNESASAHGGTVTINVASGSLSFDGSLSISAQGRGGFGGVNAGLGEGGIAQILVGGGRVAISGDLEIGVQAFGGNGPAGGQALGGTAKLVVQGGSLSVAGTTTLDTSAFGGDGHQGDGGNARAGAATITTLGTAASTSFGDVTVTAKARGGDGGDVAPGRGGDGNGGTVEVTALGSMRGAVLTIDGRGRGGNGGNAIGDGAPAGGKGGDALGSLIVIGSSTTGTTTIDWTAIGALASAAGGNGGNASEISGIGGNALAGNIGLGASRGTVLTVEGTISLIADAFSGSGGGSDGNAGTPGIARAGTVATTAHGGSLIGGALYESASASSDRSAVSNTAYGQVTLATVGGSLSLTSAVLQAHGGSIPGFDVLPSEVGGALSISGNLIVSTAGALRLGALDGTMNVGGLLLVDAGEILGGGFGKSGLIDAGLISINAFGGIALDSRLRSASTLAIDANGSIQLSDLAATGDILLHTQASLGIGNVTGRAETTLLALQDITTGNIRSGDGIVMSASGGLTTGNLSAGDSVFLTNHGDGNIGTGAVDAGRTEASDDPAAGYDVRIDGNGAANIGSVDAAGTVGIFSRGKAITVGHVTAGRSVVLLATTDVTAGPIGAADDSDTLIASAAMVELLHADENGNPDYTALLSARPTPLGGSITLTGGVSTGNLTLASLGNITVGGTVRNSLRGTLTGNLVSLGDVVSDGVFEVLAAEHVRIGHLVGRSAVSLRAFGDVTTGDVEAGDLSLVSDTGNVLTGSAFAYDGRLRIDSARSVATGNLFSASTMAVIARTGSVSLGDVESGSSVALLADDDVATGAIRAGTTTLIAASDMARLIRTDGNGDPDYTALFAAPAVQVNHRLLVAGGIVTGALSLGSLESVTVQGAIEANTASIVGGTIDLANVTLNDTLQIVTGRALTVGDVRSEGSIRLDATGGLAAGTISAGGAVFLTVRGTDGNLSTGGIDAGSLRPAAGSSLGIMVDSSGAASLGTVNAAGAVGVITRGGDLNILSVGAGPSIALLSAGSVVTNGLQTAAGGTVLIGSSSLASLLTYDSNGNPDYANLLAAAPVRIGGDLLVAGPIVTGSLSLAARRGLSVTGTIAADKAAFLGGAIVLDDVRLDGALKIVADQALTVGDVRSEGSIRLDATGNIVAGNLSAGDSITLTTRGDGSITAGLIDAGVVRPAAGPALRYGVFVDAAGSLDTGSIDAAGAVGVIARGGSLRVGPVSGEPSVVLLAQTGASVGGILTGSLGTTLIANSSMAAALSFDSNGDPDYATLLAATPVRMSGNLAVDGSISTGTLMLAAAAGIAVQGPITADTSASFLGGAIALGNVALDGSLQIVTDQALTIGNLRSEDDIRLDATGSISAGTVSAGGSVTITARGLGNVSFAGIDAGILRPPPAANAFHGISVDAGGAVTGGAVTGIGQVGVIARGGSIDLGAIRAGPVIALLARDDVTTAALRAAASGTVQIAASNMAALIVAGSDGNPDYSALLTASPVRLGGSILVSGPVTTGDLKLASFGSSSVQGAISASGAVDIAGGAVGLGNVSAGSMIEIFADGSLTLGNIRGENNVDLVGGNLTAGTVSAGNSIVIDAATGSINVGDLDAGILRPSTATGAAYQVALSSHAGIATGRIVAGGNIGALARGGDIALGSVTTNASLLLLGANGIATGALTTGGAATVYIGNSSLEAQFPDADFDALAPLGGFEFTPVFALAPVRVGGAVTLGGILTGRLTTASSGNFSVGTVTARTSATIDSGGAAIFNGRVLAPLIAVQSADIVIGESGGLGSVATTRLTLTIDPAASAISLGGSNSPGWSVDNREAGTLRAGLIVVAAIGAAPPVVTVGTLALGGGGSFRIQTPGSIRVTGKVAVASTAATDLLQLDAGQSIEVVTDTGGALGLGDSGGKLAGRLDLTASDLRIGTSAVLAQLAANPNFAGRDTALAAQPAVANLAGALGADRMTVLARHSFVVQNSGDATQRAGFSVGPGGLQISNSGPVDIVINGRAATTAGATLINDATFAQVSVPDNIVATSTLNACRFGVGCASVVPVDPGPPPIAPAVVGQIDRVVATIGSQIAAVVGVTPLAEIAAISQTPEAGEDATPEEKKAAEAAEKLPNVRVSRLVDVSAVASPSSVDEAITSGGNSSLWDGTALPMPAGGPK